MNKKDKPRETARLRIKLTAAVIIVLVSILLFEAGARISERYIAELSMITKSIFNLSTSDAHLDAYEIKDDSRINHWRLRPDFHIALSNIKFYQKPDARFISLDALKYSLLPDSDEKIGVLVNKQGFKGRELDTERKRFRVLALGDSTTFGTGPFDYTIFMQDYFDKSGLPVEVVNGGVEGYRPRNLLFELDRYKSIKPDIVTILIGWNALFSDSGYANPLYRYSAAFRMITKAMRYIHYRNADPVTEAMRLVSKKKIADLADEDISALNDYWPESIYEIEKLADEVHAMGAVPILVTLPGLYVMDKQPDDKGMEIGHLPEGTSNTFVLAKMTERYNLAIKNMAAENGYPLMDLAGWSVEAFVPRSYYFTDSVHLAGWGMERVGYHLAEYLKKIIDDRFDGQIPPNR